MVQTRNLKLHSLLDNLSLIDLSSFGFCASLYVEPNVVRKFLVLLLVC